MEQAKNRLQRVIIYMKKPEFLLLLGLVNLLLILCMGSRLHRSMYFNKVGFGMQQGQMMNRGYDNNSREGRGGYSNKGRGMMNQKQNYMPNRANAPVNQATTQPEVIAPTVGTGSSTGSN